MPGAAAQHVLKGTGSGVLPPMLEQYVALRDAHPDFLLLFQVSETGLGNKGCTVGVRPSPR
ncbi:hypothetical protein [Deinococcus murrayi]|uniref:hypothetical protein n=1 Tax=Deinococcus murrayi TaxID=68910 RepID=UPI00054F84C1|nr:hypothetical protein [Deinococcus murrayi]